MHRVGGELSSVLEISFSMCHTYIHDSGRGKNMTQSDRSAKIRGKTNEGAEEEGEKEQFLLFLCGVCLISQSLSGFSPVSSQSKTFT